MIKIKIDKTEVDFSNVKVGNIMSLSFKFNGNDMSIPRALVKNIDIENNEIMIEPLVDKSSENPKFESISNYTMKFLDNNGNVLIDC